MNISNAVTRRLEKLQSSWDNFRETPDARICRWVVPQDAYSLVDAFYQVNADESSDTPDIFLRFDSIFTDAQSYSEMLTAELSTMVESDREELAKEGIDISWKAKKKIDSQNLGIGFLRNFFHFTIGLDLEEDTLMVAFIAPVSILNTSEWQKWWNSIMTLEIPPQLRIMICEVFENQLLESIADKNKDKVISLKPQLDAVGMMRELMNEYGDQNNNSTHFRKAYFELAQCVGKQDLAGIRQTGSRALELARLIGYPHLEITVLCTAASGFASSDQLETGLKNYDEAYRIAKTAQPLPIIKEMPELKMDLPGGNIFAQLAVQVLFFKGAALVSAGQFDRALEAYVQADSELKRILATLDPRANPDWSNGGIPLFQRIEALRMCGYCCEKCQKKEAAIVKYQEAINAAKKMDMDARKSSTVAFAGKAVLLIHKELGNKQEYNATRETMNELLGIGWEETLPKRATQ